MADFVKHTACDNCGSSDARALYSDGSWYCWSCKNTKPSAEWLAENADKPYEKPLQVRSKPKEKILEDVKKSTKPPITREELQKVKEETQISGDGFRSISDSVYSKFRVRHAVDEKGNIIEQYCPVTQNGEIVGLKVREVPKNFYSIGRVGIDCDLFMQSAFTRGGKYVIITEGEIDGLSSYQMMKEYNDSKGATYETAVVSPTVGASSLKQIAANYKFFDTFDNIILCFDSDAVGQKAAEEAIQYLPRGKVKIMHMRLKDANEYLVNGRQRDFINDFYEAKVHVPVGVLGSGSLYNKMIDQVSLPKLPFPDFMGEVTAKLAGGMPLGHIINIGAKTGVGKTSLVNEMIYYWIFNSPYKIGLVSMELDSGQYAEVLLSRHLSRKLALIQNESEKMNLMQSEKVKTKATELFTDAEGNDRFYLLDNRDGSVEEIQDTIEELIVSCGCRVIVLDPLQDLLDGLTNEEQSVFMKWMKGVIKSHRVTFILINHMRKTQGDAHGVDEEDFQGSSTIIKSASVNIVLSRDKNADDPIERNTTKINIPKNRIVGLTGPAGEIYYDNETHTCHNKATYFTH